MTERKKRKVHSAEFKAKVGLEAVRGVKTINEISQEFGVHPVQVSQWKKEIQTQCKTLFEGKRAFLPAVKDLYQQRDNLIKKCRQQDIDLKECHAFIDTLGSVVVYRQSYFEANGVIPKGAAIPCAQAWPHAEQNLSYIQKLIGMLPTATGKGAEIGPLNSPILSKEHCDVLYVDHLDTDKLRKKYYPLEGIVEIDRSMVNDSLGDTLRNDSPLDYLVASQVFEHVPNPIRWLGEIASILRVGGLLALLIPDRRMTFDFLREESQAADIVASYLEDVTVPSIKCVYDHHSLASLINMHWASLDSVLPEDIISHRGAIKPKIATQDHMLQVKRAMNGEYLDVHAWVFTPPSFLLLMAQLAGDGLLSFKLSQFYPTDPESKDRGNMSFTVLLEKVSQEVLPNEIRVSYLQPLGNN